MGTYSTSVQDNSIDINIVVDKCMAEVNTYSEEKKEQLRKAYDNMLPDEAYLPPDIFLGGAYFKPHLSSASFPPKGHIYWYVNPDGDVKYVIWHETTWDYALKLMGNVFKTEVEAKCHVSEVLSKYREVM